MTQEVKGMVYDIQGFSVQDGPGIRTTVFLKGCPLRCPWCHSPESQAFYPQLSWISMRCIGTEACEARCIKACPHGALEKGAVGVNSQTQQPIQYIHVKRDLCSNCGECAKVCHPHALYICGQEYTVDEIVKKALADKSFYEFSGGGVTVSGGEALSQPKFTIALLKRLKEEGIRTALDTTGYAKWEIVEQTLPYTDLYLLDLKHMDSNIHRQVVGVPTELIHKNAQRIAKSGGKFQIRVPVIPLFNDNDENIRRTAEFCASLGESVTVVQLLPYHNLGVSKHLRISDNTVQEAVPPSDEKMQHFKQIVEEYGLNVMIH